MPKRYDDTWHHLEAADERAWLDQWARQQAATNEAPVSRRDNPGRPIDLADPRLAIITA